MMSRLKPGYFTDFNAFFTCSSEIDMAITAPLPDYTYEMKRRNLAGSGTCIVTVDTATGTVTNASMFKSTGNPLLDRLTIQTFKSWRFRPGTVSEVRVPISYE